MLLKNGATADKCTCAGERLPASMHSGGKIWRASSFRRNSPARRTVNSGRMRLIYDNTGTITIRQGEQFGHQSDITVHAEDTLRHDELPAAFLCVFSQLRFEYIQVEVRIDDSFGAGEPNAVDQARMIHRVGENEILFSQKRSHQAKICCIAASKIQCRLGSREPRKLFFDFIPNRSVPREQPGTGAAGARHLTHRRDNRFLQRRMFRQTEIVIRAEIYTANFRERAALTLRLELAQPRFQFAMKTSLKVRWHAIRVASAPEIGVGVRLHLDLDSESSVAFHRQKSNLLLPRSKA